MNHRAAGVGRVMVAVFMPSLVVGMVIGSVDMIDNGPGGPARVALFVVLLLAGLTVWLGWLWFWSRSQEGESTGKAMVAACCALCRASFLAGEATDMWSLDSRGQAITCVVRDVHIVKTMTGVSVTGEPTFIDSYVYSVACPHGRPTRVHADTDAWKPGDQLPVIYDPDDRVQSYAAHDVSRLRWHIAGAALALAFAVCTCVTDLIVPFIKVR